MLARKGVWYFYVTASVLLSSYVQKRTHARCRNTNFKIEEYTWGRARIKLSPECHARKKALKSLLFFNFSKGTRQTATGMTPTYSTTFLLSNFCTRKMRYRSNKIISTSNFCAKKWRRQRYNEIYCSSSLQHFWSNQQLANWL